MGKSIIFIFALAMSFNAMAAQKSQAANSPAKKTDADSKETDAPEAPEKIEAASAPPLMFTEDAGVPEPGEKEINIMVGGEFSKTGKRLEIPIVDFNYGVKWFNKDLELNVEAPFVVNTGKDEDGNNVKSRGIGNFTAGVKWNFYNNEKTGVSAAIFPQVESKLPATHPDKKGLEEPGQHIRLPIIISKEFGPMIVIGNVGVEHVFNGDPDDKNPTFHYESLAVGRRVTDRTAVMAEVSHSSDEKGAVIDIGINHQTKNPHVKVFASIGKRVGTTSDGSSIYVLTGVQISADPNPKHEAFYLFHSDKPKKDDDSDSNDESEVSPNNPSVRSVVFNKSASKGTK